MRLPTLTIELGKPPAVVCGWDDDQDAEACRWFDQHPALFAAVAEIIDAPVDAQGERAA